MLRSTPVAAIAAIIPLVLLASCAQSAPESAPAAAEPSFGASAKASTTASPISPDPSPEPTPTQAPGTRPLPAPTALPSQKSDGAAVPMPAPPKERLPGPNWSTLTTAGFAETVTAATSGVGYAFSGESSDGAALTGRADGTSATSNIQVTTKLGGMPVQAILVGTVLYLNLGSATMDKFYPVDITGPVDDDVRVLLARIDEANPVRALAAGASITSVGKLGTPVPIGGASSQAYHVTTHGSAGAPPGYTYWIDAQMRPRKVSHVVGSVTTGFEYAGWGSTATVSAPPPERIVTAPPIAALDGSTATAAPPRSTKDIVTP